MSDQKYIFQTEQFHWREVETKDGKDFYAEGHIAAFGKDLVNDMITTRCMDDMFRQLKERNIKADLQHETIKGDTETEQEINKTLVPRARFIDVKRDDTGIWASAKLNRNHPGFKELRANIKEKFLDAFSIAYFVQDAFFDERGGEEVRILDRINLLNVAFTGNPIHPDAKMTKVFAKSLDAFEGIHADPKKDTGETMTEENKDKIEVKSADLEKFTAEIKSLGDKIEAAGKDLKEQTARIDTDLAKINEKVFGKDDEEGSDPAKPGNGDEGEGEGGKPPADPAKPAEGKAMLTEIKSLGERLKALETVGAEFKSFLKSPMYKSIPENMKKELEKTNGVEKKSKGGGPMDQI